MRPIPLLLVSSPWYESKESIEESSHSDSTSTALFTPQELHELLNVDRFHLLVCSRYAR